MEAQTVDADVAMRDSWERDHASGVPPVTAIVAPAM
jgi:hypothetical protein